MTFDMKRCYIHCDIMTFSIFQCHSFRTATCGAQRRTVQMPCSDSSLQLILYEKGDLDYHHERQH